MVKTNLEEKVSELKSLLGIGIISFGMLAPTGYISIVIQQGTIAKANNYIAEQFNLELERLNNCQMYSLSP